MRRSLLVPLVAFIVICLALAGVVKYMVLSHSTISGGSPIASVVEGGALNIPNTTKVMVVATATDRDSMSINIVSALRKYTNNVQVLSYGDLRRMGEVSSGSQNVLILIPRSNGLIPGDSKLLLIAKGVLRHGGLLVVADVKPLNDSMLMLFLRKLGLDKVTLDNIRSAIYEKEITVSNGVTHTSTGEDIYVFALSLDKGEYPAMYILSTDVGVRVTPESMCSFILHAISDYLGQGTE